VRRRPGRLAPVLLACVLGGCGYHLSGHTTLLSPGIKTIGIPSFVNKTDRPELEQRITAEVISQFVTRGRYQTSSREDGVDAILRGEIFNYVQTPVAINAQGRATRYEILINARVSLVRAADDKVLWQDDHFVFRRQYDVEVESLGLVSGETAAIEEVAKDFAETVVTSILEGF